MTRILALAVAAVLFAGCGGTDEGAADRPADRAGTPAQQTRPAADAARSADPTQQFLEVTAEHMCEVQGTIYDTPAELAAAFEETPDYPGLDRTVVDRLRKRLATDADFSGELNQRVSRDCG